MNRINKSATRLFEVWCEVEPSKVPTGPSGNVIKCFPDTFRDEKVLNDIGEFAFPCEFEKTQVQVYSFVLTDTNSQWRFGFCRHDTKSDKAILLVTHLPWHEQFIKFINILAEVRTNSPHDFQRFLSEAYALGLPEPGTSAKVFANHERYSFEFKSPWNHQLPSIPESHNLSIYYNFVEPENMIDIFCAMLNERRIIFTSQHLHILSSCVLAAGDLIHPMTWQHIYIPVLPMKMKEYVNAPMPYLIGAAKSVLEGIRSEELTDVVLYDCDKQAFKSQFNDKKELPKEILEFLRKHLNNPTTGDGVSRTFLRAIVQLIGGYRDGLRFGEVITFDDQRFLEARSPKLRPFLTKILELQIFRQFVDERLASIKDGFSDEFEKEICLYSERVSKRKFKLLQNIKDKTNPALSSAMQSAKEGGRNVKSAYKVASKAVKTKIKNARSANNQFSNVMTMSGVEIETTQSENSSPDFGGRKWYLQDSNNNSSASSSPSHSYSSSDMNILAELEQAGLFEKPEVNRTLKPNSSSRVTSKSFESIPTPPLRKHNQNNSVTNVPPRPPRSNTNQPLPNPDNVTPNSPIASKITSTTSNNNKNNIIKHHAITLPPKAYDPFQHPDVPPAIQAPAPQVPPRKNNSKACSDVFNSSYEQWAIKAKQMNNEKLSVPKNNVQDTKPEIVEDLINFGLHLDEFDPLNDNSKKIPHPSKSSSAASITSSKVVGFSNPVYTINEPNNPTYSSLYANQPAAPNSLELLTDYGLMDQFTKLANGHTETDELTNVRNSGQHQKKNWMTFE